MKICYFFPMPKVVVAITGFFNLYNNGLNPIHNSISNKKK